MIMKYVRIYFEIFCASLIAGIGQGGAFLLSAPVGTTEYDWVRAGIMAAVGFSAAASLSIGYYNRNRVQ